MTLAIVGVALAVVPVSMMKLHESAQYRSAIRDVLGGLKLARSEASRQGASVPFTLYLDEPRFTVGTGRSFELPAKLEFGLIVAERELEGDRGSIRFYPDGSSTGGSVVVRRPNGDGIRIRVDWLLGRVSQEPLD